MCAAFHFSVRQQSSTSLSHLSSHGRHHRRWWHAQCLGRTHHPAGKKGRERRRALSLATRTPACTFFPTTLCSLRRPPTHPALSLHLSPPQTPVLPDHCGSDHGLRVRRGPGARGEFEEKNRERGGECVCPQPELSGSMALRLSRALPPASPSQLAVPCSGSEGEILRLSPGCVKRIGGREVGGACVRRGGKLPFSQARTVQGGHANSAKKLRPRRVPTARLLPLRMRGG